MLQKKQTQTNKKRIQAASSNVAYELCNITIEYIIHNGQDDLQQRCSLSYIRGFDILLKCRKHMHDHSIPLRYGPIKQA